jgi:hypothetical protein
MCAAHSHHEPQAASGAQVTIGADCGSTERGGAPEPCCSRIPTHIFFHRRTALIRERQVEVFVDSRRSCNRLSDQVTVQDAEYTILGNFA